MIGSGSHIVLFWIDTKFINVDEVHQRSIPVNFFPFGSVVSGMKMLTHNKDDNRCKSDAHGPLKSNFINNNNKFNSCRNSLDKFHPPISWLLNHPILLPRILYHEDSTGHRLFLLHDLEVYSVRSSLGLPMKTFWYRPYRPMMNMQIHYWNRIVK